MSKSKREGRKPMHGLVTNPKPASPASTVQPVAAPTAAPVQTKVAKAVDPQVEAARAALAKAKADAKAAEAKVKAERKADRERMAAERKAAKAEPRPTCTELKKDGTQCTSKAMSGKTTCVDHQPAWDRLTHEEHQAFGQWLRSARGPDIVEVIGWFRAKQIAQDQQASKKEEAASPLAATNAA